MIYGYIRVSTDRQTVENQRFVINEFCKKNDIKVEKWIKETISGTKEPDDSVKLEVRLEDETVWLSQMQMAELFQTTRNNVTIHISNIFKEGELEKFVVCKESLLTTQHGAVVGKTQTKSVLKDNICQTL